MFKASNDYTRNYPFPKKYVFYSISAEILKHNSMSANINGLTVGDWDSHKNVWRLNILCDNSLVDWIDSE